VDAREQLVGSLGPVGWCAIIF